MELFTFRKSSNFNASSYVKELETLLYMYFKTSFIGIIFIFGIL